MLHFHVRQCVRVSGWVRAGCLCVCVGDGGVMWGGSERESR